jgi:hypothetical protein
VHGKLLIRLATTAIALLLASGGCSFLQDATTRLPGPRLYEKGAAIIDDIRAFERRIGFKDTDNFLDVSSETESYPFCGFVSPLYLPYSYEDPAVRWTDPKTETDCRELAGPGMDVYFGQTEAVGEEGTPVTRSMLTGSLVRFVYLVIHEDCHDQFGLPQGIEEPLCNVIAYNAMVAYAAERERAGFIERAAMRRYAELESQRTHLAKAYYEQLEGLYARYARKELSQHALLTQRAGILRQAERSLSWQRGALNNVGMANDMTYSRHFPYLEGVFNALGRDLGRTVAFFRKVDALKPSRESVMKQHRLRKDQQLELIRAYEAAVLETVRQTLAEEAGGAAKQ